MNQHTEFRADWSNGSRDMLAVSDIQALWRSVLSARVPECQKHTNRRADHNTPHPYRGRVVNVAFQREAQLSRCCLLSQQSPTLILDMMMTVCETVVSTVACNSRNWIHNTRDVTKNHISKRGVWGKVVGEIPLFGG